MELVFEQGDESAPVGHALVYFTASAGDVYATYVQTFPIPMDLAKYLPQIFASMVTPEQMDSQSATAMPPVAQLIEEGIAWLRTTAQARKDDLINCGTLYSTDPANLMGITHEAVAAYSDLYRDRVMEQVAASPMPLSQAYLDMSESERLGQLTTLVGRFRDVLGTPEASDLEAELWSLSRTLPAKYRTGDLVQAAGTPGERGQELATLYLQRAYKLLNEEYLDVGAIEQRIQAIDADIGEIQPSDL